MSSRFWDKTADEKAPPKGGAFWLASVPAGSTVFPVASLLTSLLDRERKRFLAFARNDECVRSGILPPSLGRRWPEGAEVGSRSGMKVVRGGALSRIVIPSAAEGSFSFAVFSFLRGTVCMKHRFWGGAGSTVFPACRSSHILCLAANEKDFSLSLEMTNAGKRHSRIESHLDEESVKRPSISFPWKEVPRRGGGWHRVG